MESEWLNDDIEGVSLYNRNGLLEFTCNTWGEDGNVRIEIKHTRIKITDSHWGSGVERVTSDELERVGHEFLSLAEKVREKDAALLWGRNILADHGQFVGGVA